MKKMIIFFCFCIGSLATYSQNPDDCIRKIAKDFLVPRGELCEETELNSIVLIVYDYVNKADVIENERLPTQNDLLYYYIGSLNPHSTAYVMLVKNGEYTIIDMAKKLNAILDQLLEYSQTSLIEDDELQRVLEYILFQYQANLKNIGGAPIKAN